MNCVALPMVKYFSEVFWGGLLIHWQTRSTRRGAPSDPIPRRRILPFPSCIFHGIIIWGTFMYDIQKAVRFLKPSSSCSLFLKLIQAYLATGTPLGHRKSVTVSGLSP